MKSVVISCKHIVEDVEESERSGIFSDEQQAQVDHEKAKLSTGLTSLMGFAKEHATKSSAIAISNLEKSIVALNQAVLELTMKTSYSATPKTEMAQPSPQSDTVPERSPVRSLDQPLVSPLHMNELKTFLEGQTDLIVQAIQTLLFAMRQTTPFGSEFKDTVNEIIRIVDVVNLTARATFDNTSTSPVKSKGEQILDQLIENNLKLDELGNAMIANPQSKSTKQKLASSSYEIAKQVKELINLVE